MKIIGIVEIGEGQAKSRTVNGRNGSFEVREQDGYVDLGQERRRITVRLDADQAPYPAGKYKCETPCNVNGYGDLTAPRYLVLAPVAAETRKAG